MTLTGAFRARCAILSKLLSAAFVPDWATRRTGGGMSRAYVQCRASMPPSIAPCMLPESLTLAWKFSRAISPKLPNARRYLPQIEKQPCSKGFQAQPLCRKWSRKRQGYCGTVETLEACWKRSGAWSSMYAGSPSPFISSLRSPVHQSRFNIRVPSTTQINLPTCRLPATRKTKYSTVFPEGFLASFRTLYFFSKMFPRPSNVPSYVGIHPQGPVSKCGNH